ncbi:hypothetical protein Tco_0359620 [Tanacetum coccineum]
MPNSAFSLVKILAQHPAAATYSALAEDIATDYYFLALQQTNFPPSIWQAPEDNTDQGLEYLSVKYISDPIIPLYKVSLTDLPAKSEPKLFGGIMGVFTEELSEISYFLSKFLVYCSLQIEIPLSSCLICNPGK